MTLSDLLSYLKRSTYKDCFQILEDLNDYLCRAAEKVEIKAWILFLAGLVAAVVVGFFGYKLIKLILALASGYAGYFIGVELFDVVLKAHFEKLPDWSGYVLGVLVAVLFLYLGYAKFSYALFTVAAVGGYCMTLSYADSKLLALGGAFVVAVLSVLFIRAFYISVCSFGCGMLSVSFLSALLPKVESLQLTRGNWRAICLALGLAVVFAVVQFVTNRRGREDELL